MPHPKSFAPPCVKCAGCVLGMLLFPGLVVVIATGNGSIWVAIGSIMSFCAFVICFHALITGRPPSSQFELVVNLLRGKAATKHQVFADDPEPPRRRD